MENQNTETNNTANHAEEEKLFTQEDVNRIVGERLARVKTDVSTELREREQKNAQRELYLDAREKLMDAGLPKELLSAINCSSKEEMENSIKVISKFFGESTRPARSAYRVSGGAGSNSNGSGHHTGVNDPESIRKAMGLKG